MSADGPTIDVRTDLERGWTVYTLRVGKTEVDVVPEAGCNVASVRIGSQEFLRQAPSMADLRGTKFGVPVLYPSPNRVRDAHFRFDGRDYRFTPNRGKNFLHGLVHSVAWLVVEPRERNDRRGVDPPACELECELPFAPGTPRFELFPHPHVLRLTIRVVDRMVTWIYTVDNTRGLSRVPFGFGLHPWFAYLGPREETFLSVPASHWMEAIDLLPTGRLVPIEESGRDIRTPKALASLDLDDVFWGVDSDKPSVIEHPGAWARIELSATPDFTHAVVFTPKDRDGFCIENQTCSTDAHNLAERELASAAHLQVVEPGETHTGQVTMRVVV
jgi:aldose 1-epimerase